MSLVSFIGPRPNILDLEGTSRRKRLEVRQPILTNEDLEKIRCIGHFEDRFDTKTLDITYPAELGAAALDGALDRLCDRAEAAVHGGYNIIILSDRMVGPDRIPIPALLATAAVHHYLIRKGLRTSVGLVVEIRRAARGASFRCLAGYGAEAINPYLAFETLLAMQADEMPPEVDEDEVVKRYIKSIGKGLLKVMSKMGISTYQSYCGAQIFDAVGLKSDFVEPGLLRHRDDDRGRRPGRDRRGDGAPPPRRLRRRAGLPHTRSMSAASTPTACAARTMSGTPDTRGDAAARRAPQRAGPLPRLRAPRERAGGAPARRSAACSASRTRRRTGRAPVPLDEVEPAAEIVRRFVTGAMSFGSISREAHETLALAMNAIGGKSNTGEGGEEPERFRPLPDGRSKRSAIKQVASGRFGVTTEYLVNCRHDADQGRAGRQARRGRPAARPQGRREDRPGAPLDARRRPDLAAAAPRHLFDRGSGAADLRPEERQPGRRRLGQARLGGRRRHGRGRRRQGARRPHHHLGLRGRHGRLAADLDQACRLAVGDRPRRDAADPRAQPPARPRRACRSTAACAPGATSSSARCSAPTSSASRPRR